MFESKSARKSRERREREAEYDARQREEAAGRERERERKEHDAMHSEVVEALVRLGIDPDQLKSYLDGL